MSGSNQDACNEPLYRKVLHAVSALPETYWSIFRSVNVETEVMPSFDCLGNFEGVSLAFNWRCPRFGDTVFTLTHGFDVLHINELSSDWLVNEDIAAALCCIRAKFGRWLIKNLSDTGYDDPKIIVAA